MISLSSALPPLVRSLVQFTVAVYVLGAQPVAAAEELLLHVLSAGAPVILPQRPLRLVAQTKSQ